MLALSFGFGWFDVVMIKTVGKAKQNAKREVYETSQSYIEGKRQEAVKQYSEYLKDETQEDKDAIKNIVGMSFANFDEALLQDKVLQEFIRSCKY